MSGEQTRRGAADGNLRSFYIPSRGLLDRGLLAILMYGMVHLAI